MKDVDDDSNYSCSGGFSLMPGDADYAKPKDYMPGMVVTSPDTGDLAYAGETYTVLVRGALCGLGLVRTTLAIV